MSADGTLCLPQELIDAVIDELHDDIPTLKSCALAARTFVAPARRHIFKKIELTPPKGESSSTCQRFLELLTEGPHIVPLVEELCIVLAGKGCDVDDNQSPFSTSTPRSSPQTPRHWMAKASGTMSLILSRLAYFPFSTGTPRLTPQTSLNRHWVVEAAETMSLILSRLAYLKRISLIENEFPTDPARHPLSWKDLGHPLQSALEAVFASPRLEAVRLRGIYLHSADRLFPLFCESSVNEISLARVGFLSPHFYKDHRPWHCPQLRTLVLTDDLGFYSIWDYLLNGKSDLANLTSLTLVVEYGYPEAMELIAHYMLRAKCRVRTLRRRCGRPLGGATFPQSIFNPNLRFIHLSAPYLETLCSFFKSVSEESPALETITFENSASRVIPRSYTPLQDSYTAQALVHLPSLKAVEVRFISWSTSTAFGPPFSEWADWVGKSFPSLVEHNLLHVVECRIPDRGMGHSFE
ncbi:hypothetical protein R3P38DRAFT_1661960 [Favolaschia claudopus]|uniref:F-box domain-containing protein n=1 Tax=Favolaschia claudopus TaxID=2862362 RepID=A0AAW0AFE1_9AGAR